MQVTHVWFWVATKSWIMALCKTTVACSQVMLMMTVTCCFQIKCRIVIGRLCSITESDSGYISRVGGSGSPADLLLSQKQTMYCILWVIFQTLALVVEGGVSSGSAEALLKGGAGGAAGAAGNVANGGAQNGVPLAGGAVMARLVQLGGSLFIQPVGNPVGQAPAQQLIPITALQQGGTFLLGQAGGAVGNLQGQMAQQAAGGPVMVLGVVPQNNPRVDPQPALLAPGQVQLIPVAGPNNQPQLGVAGGIGNARGILRFQRSVAARLRRTQPPVTTAAASQEEEECSGMDTEENN